MTSAAVPALQLRGIRKAFGSVEVLHGVDLDAPKGSVVVLLGENGAGKSTLVKIIAGDHRPDEGEIVLNGEHYASFGPGQARSLGVRMIFQELSDAPDLTVAENISLGRLPHQRGVVRWNEARAHARRILEDLGVPIDIDATTGSLRLGERQIVEIARAAASEGGVLILDEPTAALSSQEVDRLFALMRRLRERGVAMIYITHRLDEVAEIGDQVQVLRDGRVVLREAVGDVTRRDLVSAMIGQGADDVGRPPSPRIHSQDPIAAFRSASSVKGAFADVSFEVRRGEVVALYGKIGSGTEEVAEAAFGLHAVEPGGFALAGEAGQPRGPRQAIAAGIGLLGADRQRHGTFAGRSVAENLSAPSWSRLARLKALISAGIEGAAYRRWHDVLRVRSTSEPGQVITTLSGGNQQKVLLGRWLERRSRFLVLIEPTRGVDVGARQDIYRSIRDLAASGAGVLIATSDYEEVFQVADRALVMARGRVVAHLAENEITTERLTEEAGG
ncbi:MAG: ribose transport system ATP-binding protein [Solirubrobacteraceae bacterium]|nr:ribose transport system ATP-binding protein [Solirubrobacteraceae bacterium]